MDSKLADLYFNLRTEANDIVRKVRKSIDWREACRPGGAMWEKVCEMELALPSKKLPNAVRIQWHALVDSCYDRHTLRRKVADQTAMRVARQMRDWAAGKCRDLRHAEGKVESLLGGDR